MKQKSAQGKKRLRRKPEENKRLPKSASKSAFSVSKSRNVLKLKKRTNVCNASLRERKLKSDYSNNNCKYKKIEKCFVVQVSKQHSISKVLNNEKLSMANSC